MLKIITSVGVKHNVKLFIATGHERVDNTES